MNNLLSVVARPGDGLALIHVRHFGQLFYDQLWAKVNARKHGTCDASGRDYMPGAEVYRPLGNTNNRSQRILAKYIEECTPISRVTAKENGPA